MVEARPEGEWARFWVRGGVEHLYAHYVTHAFVPHTHEGYVVAAVEGGVQAFRYRGALHRAPPGHVIFINPGEVHTGSAVTAQGWVYRPFYPSVQRLSDVARTLGRGPEPYFTEAVVCDPDLAARVRRYHRLSERGDALGLEEAFLEFAVGAVTRHADGRFRLPEVGREPEAVRRTKGVLEDRLSEDVTLTELGTLTGLSSYALLRAFRRHTGLTPHAYRTLRRVEAAKKRLLQGEAIAAAAVNTGFFDQSHLGRHFRRVVGVTPKAFVRGAISS